MDQSKLAIGEIIRNERQSRGLSILDVSKRTGVSKAMIGQIERGESSPTLSTVWKLSVGMRIPMATLLAQAQNKSEEYKVVSMADIEPVSEYSSNIKVYNIFPFDPFGGFDFLYCVIDPHSEYKSVGHPNAVEEYVFVVSGNLLMHVGDKVYPMQPGDSLTFTGGEEHSYENASDDIAVFQNILRY